MKKFPTLLLTLITLALAFIWLSCDSGTSLPTVSNQFAFVRPAGGGTATAMSAAQRHYQSEHMREMLQSRKLQRMSTGLKPMDIAIAPGTDSVVLMNSDGTGENVISNQGGWFYSVHLAPDGKKGVAIAEDNTGYWQVYYVDLTSANNPVATQLTNDSEDHWSAQISWDGKKVVFVKYVSDADYDLVTTMTYSGSSWGAETVVAPSTLFEASYPAFAPDGKIVLENDDKDIIVVMNADGTGLKELTGGTADANAYDWTPSVSPDGTTVVFERDSMTANEYYICTVPIAGGTVKQLTTSGYSADPMYVNNKIVYLVYPTNKSSWELASMDANGQNQKQLTTNAVDEFFDYEW